MSSGPGSNWLLGWSLRAYPLLLYAFPTEFRLEFGDSMTQMFQDLARAAWRRSGIAGLVMLWLRTVRDVALGIRQAYSMDRRMAMTRVAARIGALFIAALAATVAYGGVRFQAFYDRPAFSNVGNPQPLQENDALAAHGRALGDSYGRYRAFTRAGGMALAILLGLGSALFGLSQKSLLHGAGAFAAGATLTIAAFEILPSIWYPFDRYSVAFTWALNGLPVGAVAWLVTTVAGRLPARPRRQHA